MSSYTIASGNGSASEWRIVRDNGPFILQYLTPSVSSSREGDGHLSLRTVEYHEKEGINLFTGAEIHQVTFTGLDPPWETVQCEYETDSGIPPIHFGSTADHPSIGAREVLAWMRSKRKEDYVGSTTLTLDPPEKEINASSSGSGITLKLKFIDSDLNLNMNPSQSHKTAFTSSSTTSRDEIHTDEPHIHPQSPRVMISHKSPDEERLTYGLFTYQDLQYLSKSDIRLDTQVHTGTGTGIGIPSRSRDKLFWSKVLDEVGPTLLSLESDRLSTKNRIQR
ncbi:uncharacterized protein I303_100032 [Kwoniella dejecticola CBS 10117]|uniref:Uncharacterized protein n=1 Tax=Kwoniella dejecticola CBS 10117 TaxID=1296121 RepID=A0A1A6ADS3_9TREE|nr:uncharacterized protein I303_00032 [Kwoniella dejecticola CBS 10117]OBR88221.1 hypothetical protein I303_00032 [Kwoniella dejecticola CBS 10117]